MEGENVLGESNPLSLEWQFVTFPTRAPFAPQPTPNRPACHGDDLRVSPQFPFRDRFFWKLRTRLLW